MKTSAIVLGEKLQELKMLSLSNPVRDYSHISPFNIS